MTTHPAFKPIVDVRARIYDMAHEAEHRGTLMTYVDERRRDAAPSASSCRARRQDWRDKRAAVDAVLDEIGGVVTRVGDETVGEMWSLFDGQDVLNEIDPRFAENIRRHIDARPPRATRSTSRPTPTRRATARSGRRTRTRTCCCTSCARPTRGIVVRGAKYETAAAYANQAFVKPTIANWGDAELSDYAVGFIADMGAPGHQAHLPHRLRRAARRSRTTRCPTASTRSIR